MDKKNMMCISNSVSKRPQTYLFLTELGLMLKVM